MRRILLLITILIVATTSWGTVVISYTNSTRVAQAHVEPMEISTATPTPSLMTGAIRQGNPALPEIALTFDDGPDPHNTQQILDVLAHYNVHATFFCIGQRVREYPTLVQQEASDGHAVGNHTWSHPDLTQLPDETIQAQITDTSNALRETLGTPSPWFRQPYGATDPHVQSIITRNGLTSILWDVDTLDWQRPASNVIVNRALNGAKNGAIILMHDGGGDRSRTVAALPTIITLLRQRGYQFVTIPQLVQNLQKGSTTQAG